MTPFSVLAVRWVKHIFAAALFVGLITGLVVTRLPRHWDVAIAITVPVPARQVTDNYEYDGYYALQATDQFSNTLSGWFKSPEFVAQVYRKAGVSPKNDSLRRLEKMFTVRKLSGQLLEVEIRLDSEQAAGRVSAAVAEAVKERVAQFNDEGNGTLRFSVFVGKPLIIAGSRSVLSDAVIAAFLVVIVGFNLVIIGDAFNNNKNPSGA